MNPNETAKLVELARSGDPNSKAELCRKTYQKGYYSALRVVGNPDDAIDIVQDSYMRAFANLQSLKQDSAFERWLTSIVMNNTWDFIKKKKPTLFADLRVDEMPFEDPVFEDDREDFRPDSRLDISETSKLMSSIVDALPEDQRICVLMYYYQELSIAEIAYTLQIPENSVKSRLFYAHGKIKDSVLAMEQNQGVKLYGAAPIPLLIWLLRGQGAATAATVASIETMAAAVSGAMLYATPTISAMSGTPPATVSSVPKVEAVTAAAGAASKATGTKIAASVVAGLVIISAGVVGVGLKNNNRQSELPSTESERVYGQEEIEESSSIVLHTLQSLEGHWIGVGVELNGEVEYMPQYMPIVEFKGNGVAKVGTIIDKPESREEVMMNWTQATYSGDDDEVKIFVDSEEYLIQLKGKLLYFLSDTETLVFDRFENYSDKAYAKFLSQYDYLEPNPKLIVLPRAYTFTELSLDGMPEGISEAYKANNNSGYIFRSETKGWFAEIVWYIGIDQNGSFTGILMYEHDETPGVGTRVGAKGYLEQYVGLNDPEAVDAVSGATKTSNALKVALAQSLQAYHLVD